MIVTVPSSFTISKGGSTLTVDQLTVSPTGPILLDNKGKGLFYVGGRLTIPTNQSGQAGLTGDLTISITE